MFDSGSRASYFICRVENYNFIALNVLFLFNLLAYFSNFFFIPFLFSLTILPLVCGLTNCRSFIVNDILLCAAERQSKNNNNNLSFIVFISTPICCVTVISVFMTIIIVFKSKRYEWGRNEIKSRLNKVFVLGTFWLVNK